MRADMGTALRTASLLMVMTAVGCSDKDFFPSNSERPEVERSIRAEVDWEKQLTIGGTEQDSLLLMPTRPTVSSAGIYLADFAKKRVMRFGHDGSLYWTFGQEGGGPAEFAQPRDVRVDASGNVWVLDTGNMRVTVLDSEGRVRQQIRLASAELPTEVLPFSDGSAMLIGHDAEAPFTHIAATGDVIRQAAFPWEEFAELPGLVTQFRTAYDPERGLWATTFNIGDGFFLFSGHEWTGREGRFVEEVRFPVPEVTQNGNVRTVSFRDRPISSAVAATLSPERLYVLFGGQSDDRFRIVDAYDLDTGAYETSYRLPERAFYLAWYDGGFYAMHQNPYMELAYWKPSNEHLP